MLITLNKFIYNRRMSSDKDNIEGMASAIEDLLYMEAIELVHTPRHNEKASLSRRFSVIASTIMSNMNQKENEDDETMRLMYYSLLIYMNEYLKVPKSLTMAFGNDLEKLQEEMQCSQLISNYIKILQGIFLEQRKQMKGN
jgi:hypothetical protein